MISRLILARPEISFRYINQDKTVYHSPGNGSLLSAIITVYGKDIKNSIIGNRQKR
jgi:DNA mismatch repair protein MutL